MFEVYQFAFITFSHLHPFLDLHLILLIDDTIFIILHS